MPETPERANETEEQPEEEGSPADEMDDERYVLTTSPGWQTRGAVEARVFPSRSAARY